MLISVEMFKTESFQILEAGFGQIIEKAIATPTPTSNISDGERAIIDTNSTLVKLILNIYDVLGPNFVFNRKFIPTVCAINKWLIESQIKSPFDKKNVACSIKALKIFLIAIRGNLVGMPPEQLKTNLAFASKKALQNWANVPIDLQ